MFSIPLQMKKHFVHNNQIHDLFLQHNPNHRNTYLNKKSHHGRDSLFKSETNKLFYYSTIIFILELVCFPAIFTIYKPEGSVLMSNLVLL